MSNLATEITLHDPLLFRQACYIDGTWVGALDGAVIDGIVDGFATGKMHRCCDLPRGKPLVALHLHLAEIVGSALSRPLPAEPMKGS